MIEWDCVSVFIKVAVVVVVVVVVVSFVPDIGLSAICTFSYNWD